MTSLTDTQVVTASGGLVELGYITRTTDFSATTTNPNLVFPTNLTVVCDGSPVLVEFSVPRVDLATANPYNHITGLIRVDGTDQSRLFERVNWNSGSNRSDEMYIAQRLTPAAGTRTFNVNCYVHTIGANSALLANAWGTVNPIWMRISKIVQATQWPAVTTGTIICTSTTRPASPFEGQEIYETDTKNRLYWNGSSWVRPWNTPWGIVGIGEHNTGAQVAANTSFCSVTFNPVLGRYYQAFYTSRTIWATAGTIGIFDSVANGRIAEQYGAPDPVTLQRTKTFSSTASRTLSIRTDGVQTPISGSYSGNERPAQLVVMDVGPA